MLIWFYKLPIWFVCIGIIAATAIWAQLHAIALKQQANKKFKISCTVFLCISILLIIYATLIGRPNNASEMHLMPFQSFIEAKTQPEMYRTMFMNVVLFIPLGLFLTTYISFTLSKYKSIILSIILSVMLSIAIETTQYYFGIGIYQTDDIICNFLGALLGSLALLQVDYFKN